MPTVQPPTVSIAAAVALALMPSSAVAADGVPAPYYGAAAILGMLLCGVIIFLIGRGNRQRQTELIQHNADKVALQKELDQARALQQENRGTLEQARQSLSRVQRERDDYRAVLDAAPFAIWERNTDLSLAWINRTYGQMIGDSQATAHSPGVVEIASAIDPEQPRRLARQALQSSEPQRETRHFVIGGDRRALEIWETPLAPGGSLAGFAVDATELEESQTELARHIEAHAEVLENMATAIAIYGPDKRLMFSNRAYTNLWRLEEDFLNQAPHISEVVDAQRENRRLPEQADFIAYKDSRLALFTNVIDPQENLVQLPDETMLRTVISAHPFGGLLFMFEDVTDQLVLERSRNTLIAVQRATLNNLYEGVAVFGSDGRIKLFNSEYARIWGLDEEFLLGEPHVGDILNRANEPLLRSPERRDRIIAETSSGAGGGTIATIALFMNLCASRIAATQFAVYMALSNLALSTGAALLGPLHAVLSFQSMFYLVAGVDVVMLGLITLFSLDRHKSHLQDPRAGSQAPCCDYVPRLDDQGLDSFAYRQRMAANNRVPGEDIGWED